MAFSYKNYQESDEVKLAKQKLDANSTYKESDAVKQYKAQLEAQNALKPADWSGGTYGNSVKEALDKILNREKFTYDLNGDALYQQYKDQYVNQGRMAMQDTMGQAAAMTGGYGNSYAATVGNQTYQGYLQKLNDVVPELYQLALNQYNQEGTDLQNQYSMLANQYNTEYGEYRDSVGDWQNQRDYLSNMYNNERNFDYGKFTDNRDYLSNAYQFAYNKDYGQYSDAYDRAFALYQQNLAEANARRSSSGGSSRRSSGGSSNSNTKYYITTNYASPNPAAQAALQSTDFYGKAKQTKDEAINSGYSLSEAKKKVMNYLNNITDNSSTKRAVLTSLGLFY